MTSLILSTAARLIVPVLALFSLFLLFRGHDEPGGGFAGGLVAASAVILVAISVGAQAARRLLMFEAPVIVGAGLGLALVSGLLGVLAGEPVLTGLWIEVPFGGDVVLKVGTPLVFDIAVFLVVVGATTGIVLGLIEQRAPIAPAGED
jgi:multisubunit Na+/H+ antiporter MnhB subunit